jgi:hypothetical protein
MLSLGLSIITTQALQPDEKYQLEIYFHHPPIYYSQ